MPEKVLTISVAAYNVEKTLRKALDSLVVPIILDKLEVFVIDDGGTDSSFQIAQEFERKYPETFHAVHKENGGYGSTVNYSIAHASGKYIKLLDGDDWFDSSNLPGIMILLNNINADMVITPFIECGERSGKRERKEVFKGRASGFYKFKELPFSGTIPMHSITYRTGLIRSIKLHLTERCFYTDKEFACLPIPYVRTAYIWDHPLYMYRFETEGQSVSLTGMRAHYKDHLQVFWKFIATYKQADFNNKNEVNIYKRILKNEVGVNINVLCLLEKKSENYEKLKLFCEQLKREVPEIVWYAMWHHKSVFAMYVSNYTLYPICCRYCVWKMQNRRFGD